MLKCKMCEKELVGKQRVYCSGLCKSRTDNAKYQCYAAQKKRGLERKIKAVNLKGGCCSKCGYKKNYGALHFHHLDPSIKEEELDIRKFSNGKWDKALKELEKCVLLCANCHAELHYPELDI